MGRDCGGFGDYTTRAADTVSARDVAVNERFEATALPAAVHQGSGEIAFRPRRVGRAHACASVGTGEHSAESRACLLFFGFFAGRGDATVCFFSGAVLTADGGDSACGGTVALLACAGRFFTELLTTASTRVRFRFPAGVQVALGATTVPCLASCAWPAVATPPMCLVPRGGSCRTLESLAVAAAFAASTAAWAAAAFSSAALAAAACSKAAALAAAFSSAYDLLGGSL